MAGTNYKLLLDVVNSQNKKERLEAVVYGELFLPQWHVRCQIDSDGRNAFYLIEGLSRHPDPKRDSGTVDVHSPIDESPLSTDDVSLIWTELYCLSQT